MKEPIHRFAHHDDYPNGVGNKDNTALHCPLYPIFEPGSIIVPLDRYTGKRALNHTFTVVMMLGNSTGVSIRYFGEPETSKEDSVSSRAYRYATAEEIAAAVADLLRGKTRNQLDGLNALFKDIYAQKLAELLSQNPYPTPPVWKTHKPAT